jgi:hypothetical protein
MIRFSCPCGKHLQAREQFAGEQITCPGCGARLTVPDPPATQVQEPPRPRPSGGEVQRRPGRGQGAGPRRNATSGSSATGWIIGGIAAGVVVLAAGIVVLLLVLGGGASGDRMSSSEEPNAAAISSNNLHQIGLAMHSYNANYGRLPPAVVYDKDGKPLYSWRVLLLPFLERNDLAQEFHYDEAWDSPHNKTLLERIPKVYQHPGDPSSTNSHYLVFDSPGCAFNSKTSSGLPRPFPLLPRPITGQVFEAGIPSRIPATFLDGLSNTILVIEADESVPWTKPVDLSYVPSQPLPSFGKLYASDRFIAGMGDGSHHTLYRSRISDTTFRAAITAAGNDNLGSDW